MSGLKLRPSDFLLHGELRFLRYSHNKLLKATYLAQTEWIHLATFLSNVVPRLFSYSTQSLPLPLWNYSSMSQGFHLTFSPTKTVICRTDFILNYNPPHLSFTMMLNVFDVACYLALSLSQLLCLCHVMFNGQAQGSSVFVSRKLTLAARQVMSQQHTTSSLLR